MFGMKCVLESFCLTINLLWDAQIKRPIFQSLKLVTTLKTTERSSMAKSKTIIIRIEQDMYERLIAEAGSLGITISELVRMKIDKKG